MSKGSTFTRPEGAQGDVMPFSRRELLGAVLYRAGAFMTRLSLWGDALAQKFF